MREREREIYITQGEMYTILGACGGREERREGVSEDGGGIRGRVPAASLILTVGGMMYD